MRNSFEKPTGLEERMDREAAFKKAEEILRKDAANPADFIDSDLPAYSAEAVAADEEYVKKMEAKFALRRENEEPEEKEWRELATIFEAIFYEQAELSEWLGENAETIAASRYDDIANGVDGVVSFTEDEGASHLGLTVDVTTAENIDQKFGRIEEEIKSGRLARLKYFRADESSDPGLEHVPRVIIGADRETIKELSDLWLNGDNRALAKHPVQLRILQEINEQLKAFDAYATENGQEELAEHYRVLRAAIAPIFAEKRKIVEDNGKYDSVFAAIEVQLERFKKQSIRQAS